MWPCGVTLSPAQVIARSGITLAFFHDGNADAAIECLPSCINLDSPALYPPTTVAEHLAAKLAGSRALKPNAHAQREAARLTTKNGVETGNPAPAASVLLLTTVQTNLAIGDGVTFGSRCNGVAAAALAAGRGVWPLCMPSNPGHRPDRKCAIRREVLPHRPPYLLLRCGWLPVSRGAPRKQHGSFAFCGCPGAMTTIRFSK